MSIICMCKKHSYTKKNMDLVILMIRPIWTSMSKEFEKYIYLFSVGGHQESVCTTWMVKVVHCCGCV